MLRKHQNLCCAIVDKIQYKIALYKEQKLLYPNCIKNKYATSRGHVDQGTMNNKKTAYVYVTTRC
jgi:hypothetical protein